MVILTIHSCDAEERAWDLEFQLHSDFTSYIYNHYAYQFSIFIHMTRIYEFEGCSQENGLKSLFTHLIDIWKLNDGSIRRSYVKACSANPKSA
jgi:hypothetical protein